VGVARDLLIVLCGVSHNCFFFEAVASAAVTIQPNRTKRSSSGECWCFRLLIHFGKPNRRIRIVGSQASRHRSQHHTASRARNILQNDEQWRGPTGKWHRERIARRAPRYPSEPLATGGAETTEAERERELGIRKCSSRESSFGIWSILTTRTQPIWTKNASSIDRTDLRKDARRSPATCAIIF
jgi:hypothetical protein